MEVKKIEEELENILKEIDTWRPTEEKIPEREIRSVELTLLKTDKLCVQNTTY